MPTADLPAAARLYALVAALVLPASFRREFGLATVRLFADLHSEARQQAGWRGGARVWWRELGSLLRVAWGERRAARAPDLGSGGRRRDPRGAFVADLRFALRMLTRTPGLSAVVVLTLALGIGANTAVFSIVNSVLLRPLPYEDPERVVQVVQARLEDPDNPRVGFRYDDYQRVRGQIRSVAHLAGYRGSSFEITGAGEPMRATGWRVSPALFDALRVEPLMGRTFLPGDDQPGNEWVVVLSHAFWQQRLGADPGVLGGTLTLDGIDHAVIGILPPGFTLLDEEREVWIPLTIYPRGESPWADIRVARWIGRLADGTTPEQAAAELDALNAAKIADYPAELRDNYSGAFRVVPLQEQLVSGIRLELLWLQAAVGLVLLVACSNVANLLLIRSSARHKEIAIRAALGASRLRLAGQLLTESLVLALLGGAFGLTLALWGTDSFLALMPEAIPRLAQVSVDAKVLLFAMALSGATGAVFGAAPGLRASSPNLQEELKEGGAAGTSRSPIRLRSVLVVSQVALAMVLAVGAGLLVNSFVRVINVPPGFDPERVLTLQLDLPQARYPETAMHRAFYDQLLESIREIPAVEAVGMVNTVPLGGTTISAGFQIDGRPAPTSYDDYTMAQVRVVSPGYFEAMGIPLLRGRGFREESERLGSELMVINDEFARQYFPGEDPIGQRLVTGDEAPWEITGVVGGTKHLGLAEETGPEMWMAYHRFPQVLERRNFISTIFLAVRSRGDPLALLPEIRSRVLAIDPDLPVHNVLSMEQRLSQSVAQQRFYAAFVGSFAILALVLVCVGIYGVISYFVSERTHEIGVRLALGARPSDISRSVVGRGMMLAVLGVGIGLVGAWALTRYLTSQLYEVTASDPATYIGISALLALVALAALLRPAVRATRVDPLTALRGE